MKKQFFLIGTAALLSFAACNDNASDSTITTDSTTTNTQTTTEKRGTQIANFETRTFMDLKTNKPVKLRWNAEKYYYEDESGSQPYYYYDPAAKDTFDYWGRRLNSYLTYSNDDYMLDESRMPAMDMNTLTDNSSMDTSSSNMSTSGDTKIKVKDDMYKEKTDSTKLKVKNDKMKIKNK